MNAAKHTIQVERKPKPERHALPTRKKWNTSFSCSDCGSQQSIVMDTVNLTIDGWPCTRRTRMCNNSHSYYTYEYWSLELMREVGRPSEDEVSPVP